MKFLSEGELDASARLAGPAAEAAQSEEMVRILFALILLYSEKLVLLRLLKIINLFK